MGIVEKDWVSLYAKELASMPDPSFWFDSIAEVKRDSDVEIRNQIQTLAKRY